MAIFRRLARMTMKSGAIWAEAHLLYLTARDSRVQWYGRIAAAAVAVYVVSPLDIVPDPIPFIGFVDDLIVIPVGLAAVRRLVPADVLAENRERAVGINPIRWTIGRAVRPARRILPGRR